MRYSTRLAQQYRKNGYLFVARDTILGDFEIIVQYPNRQFNLVEAWGTKHEAVRRAKELSMEMQLGFDTKQDVL